MTARRTIRLAVVIPDPGEWCCAPDRSCPMFIDELALCTAGHDVDARQFRVPRPQSCRDAEVKE